MPIQIKRECDFPLIGRINEEKKAYTQIPTVEFEKDLMPITTGHFGLTVFGQKASTLPSNVSCVAGGWYTAWDALVKENSRVME